MEETTFEWKVWRYDSRELEDGVRRSADLSNYPEKGLIANIDIFYNPMVCFDQRNFISSCIKFFLNMYHPVHEEMVPSRLSLLSDLKFHFEDYRR